MPSWNPNSTALKGLEWGPTVQGGVVLDSFTKSAVMSVRQTVAQAIGSARVWVGAIPTRGGQYIVEVYDDEDCVATSSESVLTARPNRDIAGQGTGTNQWRQQDGSAVTIYDVIDEATLSTADYIYVPTAYPNWGEYHPGMSTESIGLTTQRVLSVTVNAIAAYTGGWDAFSVGLYIGGIIQRGQEGTLSPSPTLWTRTWSTNPYTGLPWTIDEVESFDSAATTSNSFYLSAGNINGSNGVVYQAWMDIQVLGVDNRLAIGVLDDTFSGLTPNAWNNVVLLTPAGGTWTKQASDWHTFVVRRTSSVGAMVVPTLAAADPPYSMEGWLPTLNPSTGDATAMNTVKPQLYGLILRTTAPAESTDSQPYVTHIDAQVFTGQDAEQEVSDFAASNYGGLRAWVKSNDATQDLLIKVKRRSDNVQVGQTITLTKVAADALPGSGWREAVLQMASGFTAGTGTQYYVEFSSASAGTGTDYWSVLALDTGNQGNGATHGGTTDRALINGTEADRYEIPVTLWTVPVAPTGLAAVLDTQEQPEWTAADEEGCLPLIIEYVHLSWAATTLGASFDHYELQQSDDGGATWATVGTNAVESTVTFDAYEIPRGTAAKYRLRVWRTDDAFSAWTATVTAPVVSPVGAEMLFVTNAEPTLNCAYNREGTDPMDFEFLDAEEVVFQKLYGRDYQVAFHGTERRGVRFSVPIIINAVRAPTITREGVPLFDALRALSTADIPYVCVLDHWGNRWFAELQVPEGSHKEPGRIYIGQIIITEVADTPTSVEVV